MRASIALRNARVPSSTTILTHPRVSVRPGPLLRRWLDTGARALGAQRFSPLLGGLGCFYGHPVGHGSSDSQDAPSTRARAAEPSQACKAPSPGADAAVGLHRRRRSERKGRNGTAKGFDQAETKKSVQKFNRERRVGSIGHEFPIRKAIRSVRSVALCAKKSARAVLARAAAGRQ